MRSFDDWHDWNDWRFPTRRLCTRGALESWSWRASRARTDGSGTVARRSDAHPPKRQRSLQILGATGCGAAGDPAMILRAAPDARFRPATAAARRRMYTPFRPVARHAQTGSGAT